MLFQYVILCYAKLRYAMLCYMWCCYTPMYTRLKKNIITSGKWTCTINWAMRVVAAGALHRWMMMETKRRWVGPIHIHSPAPIRRWAQLFKAQLHYKQQTCGTAISLPHLPGAFNNAKQHTWWLITLYQSNWYVCPFVFRLVQKWQLWWQALREHLGSEVWSVLA